MTKNKLQRKPNTDGMGNCLQQPGQIRKRPKSMRVIFTHLSSFVYRD